MSGWIKVWLIAALLLAASPAAWAEEVRVAGEYYTQDFILQPLKEPFERATGISLEVRMLLIPDAFKAIAGQSLDAFVNSLPDDQLFQELEANAPGIDRNMIRSTVIAKVPAVVVVARDNPVGRLSREQLKAVFTGTITSWKEIGGKNEAIRIIRPWGTPIREALRFLIMDGEDFAPGMLRRLSWEDARMAVMEVPDAITVLPSSIVDDSVKVLDTPEIAQFATVLTRGEPSGAVQKFIDYAKGDGLRHLKISPR